MYLYPLSTRFILFKKPCLSTIADASCKISHSIGKASGCLFPESPNQERIKAGGISRAWYRATSTFPGRPNSGPTPNRTHNRFLLNSSLCWFILSLHWQLCGTSRGNICHGTNFLETCNKFSFKTWQRCNILRRKWWRWFNKGEDKSVNVGGVNITI